MNSAFLVDHPVHYHGSREIGMPKSECKSKRCNPQFANQSELERSDTEPEVQQ